MSLSNRYPDLYFLLRITPHKKVRLTKRAQRLEQWLVSIDLEEVEIFYLIGLIGYPLPKRVMQWLSEKKERTLIFIESRLGAFASFREEHLYENPQIHFFYAESDPIEHLASEFPSERIAIYEGEKFDTLSLKRRSASYSALYSDVLYSHKIVKNVLQNLNRLPYCFDARGELVGVPLVVCGAGPSLEHAIETLKKHQNRALILAVGSAITVLTNCGITPHLAMALDPNDEEFRHLAQGCYFEGPFIFSPRLHHHVFSTSNGPFGYLGSDTGGFLENFLEKALPLKREEDTLPCLGAEAFSVTTLALAWASAQGFSEIVLAGVDLAYAAEKRYARGVMEGGANAAPSPILDQTVDRRDLFGNWCKTLIKWGMEADAISAFAKRNSHIRFVNTSLAGLGFEGIPNDALENVLSQFPQQDLRAIAHVFSQQTRLSFDLGHYRSVVLGLSDSIAKCGMLCDALLEERSEGKRILLVSDLEEEMAYRALLEGIDHALQHLLCRYFPHLNPQAVARQRDQARFEELKRQIELFRKSLCDVIKEGCL